MIELEVLVEVFDSYDYAYSMLSSFNMESIDRTVDTYYYDPMRKTLQPNDKGKLFASFRIREKGSTSYLTYKVDHYENGLWQYSDEYETAIGNTDAMRETLVCLGLKKLLTIDNVKTVYTYEDYEIVLERVNNLGVFLEVECKRSISTEDVHDERLRIYRFIESLGLHVSDELNCGKPELYLLRNGWNDTSSLYVDDD